MSNTTQTRDPMELQKRNSAWIGSPIGLRPDQTASPALLLESPSLSYNLQETSASRLRPQHDSEDEYVDAETGIDSQIPIESRRDSGRDATATKEDGDDVLDELSRRAVNLFKLFRLAAEREGCLDQPVEQWLRIATWWLLKTKKNLSIVTYNKLSLSDRVCQDCHRYLAKTLWVVEEALSLSKGRSRNSSVTGSEGTLSNEFGVIKDGLRKLANTMKQQDLLAPTEAIALVVQDFDYSIMVQYPSFTPDIWDALSRSNRGPLVLQDGHWTSSRQTVLPTSDLLPLSDTTETFIYATMFVDVLLFSSPKEAPTFKFPCLLSVRRQKTQKIPEVLIASQNARHALLVPLDSDIKWHMQPYALEIKMWMGFTARVQMSSWDFYGLRRFFNYTSHMKLRLHPWAGEELIFEATAKSVQYTAPKPEGQRFPTQPAPNCVVRVFENVTTETMALGAGNSQRGFRLAVMTDPGMRDLRYVCHNMGFGNLLRYTLVENDSDQGVHLTFGRADQESSMTLSFRTSQARDGLLRALTGQPASHEIALADVPLRSITTASTSLLTPSSPSSDSPFSALSPHRILVHPTSLTIHGTHGILTDRLPLRTTTLLIHLPHRLLPHGFDHRLPLYKILVYRAEASDLTLGITPASVPLQTQNELAAALQLASCPKTVREYQFEHLNDLHTFQSALTGHTVLYDSYAPALSIARRRRLLPISTAWKATDVRLQVVSSAGGRVVKLAAFFQNFKYAEAMVFEVKAVDVVEAFRGRGGWGLRIVDAKFAAPRTRGGGEGAEDGGFVDIRVLEYPGEHDDITILFEGEEERDKFASVLPAFVNRLHKV